MRNDQLICDVVGATKINGELSNKTSTVLNELQDVFSNISVKDERSSSNDVDSLLLNTEVLLPLPILSSPDADKANVTSPQPTSQPKSRFSGLDKLSEDLLKEELDAINERRLSKIIKQ